MAELRLERVVRRFKNVVAVDNVNLTVRDREFMVLLGPSGCGKTTTLRCVAGLEKVDQGRIYIGPRDVTELPPKARGIGMVFQSYALFPHMSVADNIGFGLKIQGRPRAEIKAKVERMAKLLHLDSLLDRYPAQLSGGQRQRVAVARSLVIEPQVLLMDEPLSNLDAILRLEMRAELKRLHREIESTTIYVTHDQVEALSLGDRIAVMQNGRLVQCAPPMEIYDHPANIFVGSFIGTPPMNFLEGEPQGRSGQLLIRGSTFTAPVPPALWEQVGKLKKVVVGVRPENIEVVLAAEAEATAAQGTVGVVELLGDHKLLTVDTPERALKVSVPPTAPVQVGQACGLRWKEDKLRFFDPETGWAITA
ncbi:ABC transporter ATP-binding protein [Candidatus Darwinibacter acetoxidans]